jgi:hypothetical protein
LAIAEHFNLLAEEEISRVEPKRQPSNSPDDIPVRRIARQSGWEARDNLDGESVSRRGDDCRDDCRAQEFC